MRTLVVIRHAKAESFATTDHERDLTGRGRRDALELGSWLADAGVAPDHVLVSSARRTVATWDFLSRGLRQSPDAEIRDDLYSATPESALDVLREAPEAADVVIIVGHNPTVAYLAHLLDDGEPDQGAFRAMSEGYPTAAATVLEVPGHWSELTERAARITAFHVGNGSGGAAAL